MPRSSLESGWVSTHPSSQSTAQVDVCLGAKIGNAASLTTQASVYFCMKHLTLIKVRTADPTWLLHNISVYKSRPWKIIGISFSKYWSPHVSLSLSLWLSLHLERGTHQCLWDFSRQEYWSGLPFPSPENFPLPGIEPGSHLATSSFVILDITTFFEFAFTQLK